MVWVNAGHELFQEARAQTTTLLEQAISGYHEGNDVVYAMSHPEFASGTAASGGVARAGVSGAGGGARGGGVRSTRRSKSLQGGRGSGVVEGGDTFEDKYIDNVLGTMSDMQSEARHRERGNLLRACGGGGGGVANTSALGAGQGGAKAGEEEDTNADNTEMGSAWDGSLGEVYGSSWENYRASVATAGINAANRGRHFGSAHNTGAGSTSDEEERWRRNGGAWNKRGGKGRRQRGGGKHGGRGEGDGEAQGRDIMVGTVLDASHPAFERQGNLVYGFGQGSKVYPQPEEFPEVSGWLDDPVKMCAQRMVAICSGVAPSRTPKLFEQD